MNKTSRNIYCVMTTTTTVVVQGNAGEYTYMLPDPVKNVCSVQIMCCQLPNTLYNVPRPTPFRFAALYSADLEYNLSREGGADLFLKTARDTAPFDESHRFAIPTLVRDAQYTWRTTETGLLQGLTLYATDGTTPIFSTTAAEVLDFQIDLRDYLGDFLFYEWNGSRVTVPVSNHVQTLTIPPGSYDPIQLGSKIHDLHSTLTGNSDLAVHYLRFSNQLKFIHSASFFRIDFLDSELLTNLAGFTPGIHHAVQTILADPDSHQPCIVTGFLATDQPLFLKLFFDRLNETDPFIIPINAPFPQVISHTDPRTFTPALLDPPREIHKLDVRVHHPSTDAPIDTQNQPHIFVLKLTHV